MPGNFSKLCLKRGHLGRKGAYEGDLLANGWSNDELSSGVEVIELFSQVGQFFSAVFVEDLYDRIGFT